VFFVHIYPDIITIIIIIIIIVSNGIVIMNSITRVDENCKKLEPVDMKVSDRRYEVNDRRYKS
jgi:hypothetical protein